jgi:flavodoxin
VRRILVVSYSLSGRTRRVAAELARACDADFEAIADARERHGTWGYLRSALEALLQMAPSIRDARYPPGRYALVVIGTPVWAGRIASPVRTWLQRHRAQLGRVAFFCTSEGDSGVEVFRAMADLCGQPPMATLALTAQRIEQRTHRRRVDLFAGRLLEAVAQPPGAAASGRRAA